ncbi:hypothetical protein MBRA_55100 (plasmid) [Mycobacterium branderi]|uniref:Uncharacterized protein n=1 Tax=Mycobacterium branderi TaxID=43348 RepID=A0ABM7KW25_9MYCO|nr:hypothetical protein MBRA_55100 [Mycobacterium branderi]
MVGAAAAAFWAFIAEPAAVKSPAAATNSSGCVVTKDIFSSVSWVWISNVAVPWLVDAGSTTVLFGANPRWIEAESQLS